MLGLGTFALIALVSLGGEKQRQAPLLAPGRQEALGPFLGIPLSIPRPLTNICHVLAPACPEWQALLGGQFPSYSPEQVLERRLNVPPSPVTSLPSR